MTRAQLSMRVEFIDWALKTPGVYHYSKTQLVEDMNNPDLFVGIAWLAWKAAWRKRR